MTAARRRLPNHMKVRRRKFDRRARRRREIEAHAIEVGAADSDDLARWLIAWTWHNPQSKDPIGAVIEAARSMGRKGFTATEAAAVIEEASLTRKRLSADNLARFLGVTYAQRARLGLTTIGSVNVGKRARAELRKRRNRLAKERKRREQGARPHAQSLSRTEPWKAEGISRASWYRRRETDSGTAVFLSTADEVVSPATPQASGSPSGAVAAAAVPAVADGGGGRSAATPAVPESVLAENHKRLARETLRARRRRFIETENEQCWRNLNYRLPATAR